MAPAPTSTPVARRGLAIMVGLLAAVLLMGTLRNGFVRALGDLGFRSPAIAAYTLLLLSPLYLELAYPWMSRRLPAGGAASRTVEHLHRHAPMMIVIAVTMLVMRIENVWDPAITDALGPRFDVTPAIHRLEGDVVGDLQRWMRHPWLDLWFVFVYVTVYALYHAVAMFYYAATGQGEMLRRFVTTWCGIYLVALPFYVLMPVNEAWVTHPDAGCGYAYEGSPEGILNTACQSTEGIVFAISSINNCFPSLHNAFAWALPFLLWRSGRARAARWLSPVAASISLSTLYLGIHWVIDMVAGILLAWFITGVAVRLRYEVTPRLGFRGWGWDRRPAPA